MQKTFLLESTSSLLSLNDHLFSVYITAVIWIYFKHLCTSLWSTFVTKVTSLAHSNVFNRSSKHLGFHKLPLYVQICWWPHYIPGDPKQRTEQIRRESQQEISIHTWGLLLRTNYSSLLIEFIITATTFRSSDSRGWKGRKIITPQVAFNISA